MKNGGFGRALVMSSDLKGYGGGNDKRHEAMQRGFIELHRAAAAEVGTDRGTWVIQPAGDGEIAILPQGEHEPVIVDRYVRTLHHGLTEHNKGLDPHERLRLRVALAFGTAYPSVNGYAGQAVVEASRLVDWAPLKQLFNEKDEANIVLILSARLFEDVVRQGHTSYQEFEFHRVLVSAKEFSGSAWVWAPELDRKDMEHLLDLTEMDKRSQNITEGLFRQAEVINNMNGPVDARGAVFGISRK
ncbi:hypothetical protein [Planomonospora parontospora]|uniref:hypothetical protein n=1 Tax=Planomonospora parontospora TaxID=58119 RepID=UPI001670165D|nr:hypothetical protein [Planomonospora parontospora]GGL28114.1 hypothetical protein GCM10014719_31980 [Planomonospora parontospora subsp. antibiotica]GII20109.1 hypothetical protein Ppa05_68350 [Planomonospora parontospora subsp. antibiotica]